MSTPTQSVEVNGVTLAYRQSGPTEGEPLVMVHGHISDLRTWSALEKKLATRYRVYTYSKRFAWPNTPIKDDEGQPWEQDSLDLAALIETLGIGPVHALGNSSGSTNILWLARTHPHLFKTILVEEPPLITLFLPTLPPSPWAVLSFLLSHPISFWPVMIYGATTIGPASEKAKQNDYPACLTTFGSGCLGPKFWPLAMADPERKAQVDDNAKWLCHFLRHNSLPLYLATDAAQLAVPTLVITGTEGPYFQQCIDAEFLRVCGSPRKREVRIRGAGHLVHEDSPYRVYDAVVQFITENTTT